MSAEKKYLIESYYFDFKSFEIQNLIQSFNYTSEDQCSLSVAVYTAIRDGWKYDPYSISLKPERFKASHIAKKKSGNCVEKSILLIACYRALGIPARLHLGKVKNHLAVERLTEKFGSNELTPHGMVNAKINGQWLKMSPAFNKSLCEKFQVPPLDFDGVHDSFLQAFNANGQQFMEYTEDYGHFEDVPVEFMKTNIKAHYPHIFDRDDSVTEYKL